jgi:uncharacterized protein (DUF2267 family)
MGRTSSAMHMDHEYERFITTVQRKAGVSWEDAARATRATRATLETLAERLSPGQARDLAEHLPPQLSPWLFTDEGPEPFHMDEFLRRVAARADVDLETAGRHARAVFAALGRAVSEDELDDVAAELPGDFAPLIGEAQGRYVEIIPSEAFLERVADRGGLDVDGAARAVDAVLETLAERIAGGEVDDLMSRLPVELRPPLERGKALSGGQARRMSLDEFVRAVAEREGVPPERAREHARAVFATLREAVPKDVFIG